MKLCLNFYFIDVAILETACHSRPIGWRDHVEIAPTIRGSHKIFKDGVGKDCKLGWI